MRKSRFTEEQIVAILKEGEAGVPVADLLRRHSISRGTYFNWRSKYAGTTVAELRPMRELEAENREAQADVRRARAGERRDQGRPPTKAMTPAARRQVSEVLVTEHQLSVRHACRAVALSRTAWYRRPADPATRDGAVMEAVLAVVEQHGRWGFWKCFDALRLAGQPWNPKRVHRVYCALRLNLPRRTKRRVPTRLRQPLIAPTRLNGIWALDFMHDALYGGRPFRILNVLDEANREALAIEIGTSIPAARVVRVLEQLVAIYGRPQALRVDNGPEFTAELFTAWCAEQDITLLYIQPGKPDQNAFIERFNRTYREEVLDAYIFVSVSEAQTVTGEWLPTYNDHRPHESLGSLPPMRFLLRPRTPAESSYAWSP